MKSLDCLDIYDSLARINDAWRSQPADLARQVQALQDAVGEVHLTVGQRVQRLAADLQSAGKSQNGQAMDWVRTLSWASRQYHQVMSRWLAAYVAQAPEAPSDSRDRSLFWVGQIMDLLSPANYFWTNPGAVQRYIGSSGKSLQDGVENWLEDMARTDGMVRLVDKDAFAVGQDLAATPGQVVFRNHLMELIQYAPQSETTFKVPIVMIQPWINKYYIFDLVPHNSFVRFLINQGFSVFITSWKNPTDKMRHITFEDYIFDGALQAIETAREICGVDQVHATGYCIGGTALAALMAWLSRGKAEEKLPVADWTLFASLLDFSQPGSLGVFISPASLEALAQIMSVEGYLSSRYIGATFRLLNAEGLIWRYHVNNYLYGGKPPRSEVLFWNCDGTNLPEAMCNFYLGEMYLHNRLARADELVFRQRSIDLGRIRRPLYAVGAIQDHICPWEGTFAACGLTGAPVRYVLADEGHIAGIVNPPSERSKKKFWAAPATRRKHPQKWLAKQNPARGSWWTDWVNWLKPKSGPQGPPPPMGSPRYPALEPAPGLYVRQ